MNPRVASTDRSKLPLIPGGRPEGIAIPSFGLWLLGSTSDDDDDDDEGEGEASSFEEMAPPPTYLLLAHGSKYLLGAARSCLVTVTKDRLTSHSNNERDCLTKEGDYMHMCCSLL